jgi:TetR/AcrR family transcriptional regulator, transcriptional repressor for nem operon
LIYAFTALEYGHNPEVAKAVYTARLKRTLAYSTDLVPPKGDSDRRSRAILTISAMLGAINLSRAVSDPNLSREILKRTRDELISLNKEAGAEKRQETR